MIETKRCLICQGSGVIMGGGMMYHDCHNCKASGKVQEAIDEIDYLNKKSKHYKSAKKRIKALDANISDEEAEVILDKELSKIDSKDFEVINAC